MASWPGQYIVNNAGETVTNNLGEPLVTAGQLPGPLASNVDIQMGTTARTREVQGGPPEKRRFGVGAPDQARVTIQLTDSEADTFEHFYQRNLNMGKNWFSAGWLEDHGYDDHQARIFPDPEKTHTDNNVNQFTFNMLIQESDRCPDDTEWPTGSGTP